MPAFLRVLSLGVPLRYLLTIMRGIVLKGVGIEMLWEQVVALVAFAVLILMLAALRFKKRLE